MPSTGWLSDVVADQPIESVWGNTIRDRTVTTFATTAERDANAIPGEGMECYCVSTKSFYYYDGTVWRGRARGRIAYATPVGLVGTGATGGVFVDALTIPITAAESRLVRVSSYATVAGLAPVNCYARLATLAATLGPNFVAGAVTSGTTTQGFMALFGTISATSTTYKVQIASSGANGGRMNLNDAANLSYLAIDDLGTP